MIYKYATITDINIGNIFSKFVYELKFLDEVDNLSNGKKFEKFDDAVVYMGIIGYNLCNVVSHVHSTKVEKAWFSKKCE